MLLNALLPTRCPLCGHPGPVPCGACRKTVPPVRWVGAPGGVTTLTAVLAYEGPTRSLLAALKYRGARTVVQWLAHIMAEAAEAVTPPPVWVTWAPTSRSRRTVRGFDQAELLARDVAVHLQLPVEATLTRVGSQHQTGRSRSQRLHPGHLFQPIPQVPLRGPVLLVDDVCTTGATISAAAWALRSAGVTVVHALVAARTP